LSEPLLRVEQLVVAYGGIVAVAGLDLEVGAGRCVALLGSNGAGKTSTVRGIFGLEPARGGRVLLAGEDITRRPVHERQRAGLGLVPEGRRIVPGLTVAENLRLGGFRMPAREVGPRIEELYSIFPSLRSKSGQHAGSLSGGEQQMLAISRALMPRPRLLLLDEPSMGLAPLVVRSVFAALAELRAQGVSMLLVEQNFRAATAVADDAYVLDRGHVVSKGPAAEVASDPAVIEAYLGGQIKEA
jgi:branched-chain amino acid transport system ATP-binding protein